MTYRIKGFNKVFVKRDSLRQSANARRTKLPWVSVPTDSAKLAMQRVAAHPRGTEIYGAFLLMVAVAAVIRPNVEAGELADDQGEPYSPDDLEALTGFPSESFAIAYEVLSSPRIGWLVEVDLAGKKPHPAGKNGDLAGNNPDLAGKKPLVAGKLPGDETRRDETGQYGTARAEPSPSEKDLFDNRPSMPIPDRELIRPLAPYVRWKGSDPDGTEDNIAELIGLIHRYGAKEVLAAAIACWESAREKVWPNVVGEHLMGQGDATPEADDFSRPLPTVCQQAIMTARHMGFRVAHAKCPQIDPTGDEQRDLARLIAIYEAGNQPAAQELLDAIEADA